MLIFGAKIQIAFENNENKLHWDTLGLHKIRDKRNGRKYFTMTEKLILGKNCR